MLQLPWMRTIQQFKLMLILILGGFVLLLTWFCYFFSSTLCKKSPLHHFQAELVAVTAQQCKFSLDRWQQSHRTAQLLSCPSRTEVLPQACASFGIGLNYFMQQSILKLCKSCRKGYNAVLPCLTSMEALQKSACYLLLDTGLTAGTCI